MKSLSDTCGSFVLSHVGSIMKCGHGRSGFGVSDVVVDCGGRRVRIMYWQSGRCVFPVIVALSTVST